MITTTDLRAPFPYFGGKSRVAGLVWQRFGDVPNYVEPFFGSGAVLLGRPHWPWDGNRIETVNDADCFVSNFWRALRSAPGEVARWADWPVIEKDMRDRHKWLVLSPECREFRAKMASDDHVGDPEFFDAKIAGWWVWGLCQWIGSGWCIQPDNGKRPDLGNAGRGVHRPDQQLEAYLTGLSARMRRVRVCNGDWSRVCGPSSTVILGTTGVFLDPPYADTAERESDLYSVDSLTVAHQVREWCIANGDDSRLRIALCGYEGEHVMPESWECVEWKAQGGYSSTGNGAGRENAKRERIWFSPHCLKVRRETQRPLFVETP